MIRSIFYLFLFFYCLSVSGQDSFIKGITEANFGSDFKIRSTADKGWVVYSPDSFKLYKFNSCGVLKWAKQYNIQPSNYKGLDFFTTTRKEGFAFLTRISGANFAHSQITNLDANGNVIWSRVFSDSLYSQTSYSLDQDNAGNFMFYSNVAKLGGGEVYNMITKIKENGDHAWTRFYNHGGIWGGAIFTDDKGILARTGHNLIKTDSTGNVEWSCRVSGTTAYYYTPIEVEDGYLIPSNSTIFSKACYFKISKTGQQLFNGVKSLNYNSSPKNLCRKTNGNVAGVFSKRGIGKNHPTIIEFDKNMNVINSHSLNYGSDFQYILGMDMDYLTNGIPVLTGSIIPGDFPMVNIFFAKMALGQTTACDTSFADSTFLEPGTVSAISTSSFLYPLQMENQTVEFNTIQPFINTFCSSAPQLKLQIEGDSILCQNGTSNLQIKTNSDFDAYEWSNGKTSQAISVAEPGKYWLKATNSCREESATDTFEIRSVSIPEIPWFSDTSFCDSDTILLNAKVTGATYLWQDGSQNFSLKATLPGNYNVSLTISGCEKSWSTHLEDCEILEMPNLFTPNNDQLNDRFVAKEIKGIPFVKLEIYNRWGQKIFTTNEIKTEGWNGEKHNNGVYYWSLNYTNYLGQEKRIVGTVLMQKG